MALAAQKATVAAVKRKVNLHASFFQALSQDEQTLEDRIQEAIVRESAKLQASLGASTYSSTTEPQHTCVKSAEELRAAAHVIEEMITTIASDPQMVAIPEADVSALERQVERYMDEADEFLTATEVDVTDRGRVFFSLTSDGIDETLRDDYPEIDFGDLSEVR